MGGSIGCESVIRAHANSRGELALVTWIAPSASLCDGKRLSISVSRAKSKQAIRRRHGRYDLNNYTF